MLCNFFIFFFLKKFGEFPPSKTGCEWRVVGGPVPFGLIPTRATDMISGNLIERRFKEMFEERFHTYARKRRSVILIK